MLVHAYQTKSQQHCKQLNLVMRPAAYMEMLQVSLFGPTTTRMSLVNLEPVSVMLLPPQLIWVLMAVSTGEMLLSYANVHELQFVSGVVA
jgi:hypothetical protein